jgi:hypothetical protein
MAHILVLFNLKPGVSVETYERFAKNTDLPIVRGLKSIESFDVYKATGLLGSSAAPPYAYAELIAVNDMGVFGQEVASETMQKVAGEFQALADNPLFILCDKLDG